jgi:hypothetical protein
MEERLYLAQAQLNNVTFPIKGLNGWVDTIRQDLEKLMKDVADLKLVARILEEPPEEQEQEQRQEQEPTEPSNTPNLEETYLTAYEQHHRLHN